MSNIHWYDYYSSVLPRAQQSTSKSRNLRLFMETDGSLLNSQQLISDSYPKLIKHSPHPQLPICFSPSTSGSSKHPFSFRFSNQNSVCISHISHPCYNFHLYYSDKYLKKFKDKSYFHVLRMDSFANTTFASAT
jgi:hypothetical protein